MSTHPGNSSCDAPAGLLPARLLPRILEAVRPLEFRTFVLGFERPELYDREAHELLYRGIKQALGDALEAALPGACAEFKKPEVRIHISAEGHVRAIPSPLFLGGRYRKHSREIPATRWIHHRCGGRGCASCDGTGNLCGPSIQELLTRPLLEATGGVEVLLHALGREDTDARMLGRGRPFAAEVRRPVRRSIDLRGVEAAFREAAGDLADVWGLATTDKEAVHDLKFASAEKTYRAWICANGPLPTDAGARIEALNGAVIRQLSPTRVEHRKGRDTLRLKRVLQSDWLGELDARFVWETRVESGTYVKELVSGDGGRTSPSITELLGASCYCEALDVLEVHWTPPWER